MAKPSSATLFVFNVGFGDCFLLRFNYADASKRHVLIDFGSMHPPKGVGQTKVGNASAHMRAIASEIEALSGGTLDILVATHRHKDHISGFATAKDGDGPGDTIARLKPKAVLQPWTEDGDVAIDATMPKAQAARAMNQNASRKTLRAMESYAQNLEAYVDALAARHAFSERELEHLKFIGANNVANKGAVTNLQSMGKAGRPLFLKADDKPDLSLELPGVKVHVLGPPTIEQQEGVDKQAAHNDQEYWHLAALNLRGMRGFNCQGQAGAAGAAALFPGHVVAPPAYARWAKSKLAKLQLANMLAITTALDKAMNNTSLILLFEIGEGKKKKRLLFPGDAQFENWRYALSKPEYQEMLTQVDLYKVGHHGSLNATPKSLWRLFAHRHGDEEHAHRLVSVMSTLSGVYDGSAETAVPRSTLVEALGKESNLHSTDGKDANSLVERIEIAFN
jgi:hypothetical protein